MIQPVHIRIQVRGTWTPVPEVKKTFQVIVMHMQSRLFV
jgi:hypothetical protein